MTIVKFIKKYSIYNIGEVAGFDLSTAKDLEAWRVAEIISKTDAEASDDETADAESKKKTKG